MLVDMTKDKLKRKKEIRVYLINSEHEDMPEHFDFKELLENKQYDEIKDLAESQGLVYSLKGFQDELNIVSEFGECDFNIDYCWVYIGY